LILFALGFAGLMPGGELIDEIDSSEGR